MGSVDAEIRRRKDARLAICLEGEDIIGIAIFMTLAYVSPRSLLKLRPVCMSLIKNQKLAIKSYVIMACMTYAIFVVM